MSRFKPYLVIAAALALAVPVAYASEREPFAGERRVTVMTRNVYLGTDLTPIFQARSQPELLMAVGSRWAQVQANDFPTRADAIASEIAAAQPDLVGLQEAMLYRTDTPADGPATAAETIALDFVQILLDRLAARGQQYRAVSSFRGVDIELPAGYPPALDVRLTDRVVVLARADEKVADLKLENPQAGTFGTLLTLPTLIGPLVVPRGWASVDVKTRGRSFRFVTTHLEAFAAPVRNAQAAELVSGPTSGQPAVVLVGDMNSGPGFDPTARDILLGGGFTDAWVGDGGFTCCFGVDLHDASVPLTKRIDLVLTKGAATAVEIDVVGDESADRTASGLWPSDHAGVVATVSLTEPEPGSEEE